MRIDLRDDTELLNKWRAEHRKFPRDLTQFCRFCDKSIIARMKEGFLAVLSISANVMFILLKDLTILSAFSVKFADNYLIFYAFTSKLENIHYRNIHTNIKDEYKRNF